MAAAGRTAVNCSTVDRFGLADAHPELQTTIDSVRTTEETAHRPTSRRTLVIITPTFSSAAPMENA
jgi:hypothetical protein